MSNDRILKNSAFLYMRLLITLGLGLFTTRIVINALGIDDYGIYGVVAGLITMFGFMNAAMSSSTQRYLSFDLGLNDTTKLQQTFTTAINIHLLIGVVSFLLAQGVGLWAISCLLDIPEDRLNSANTVFQFSLITFFFGIIQVPYHAVTIAYERMNAYAYISIFDAALKLLAAYLLTAVPFDGLVFYSQLLAFISILTFTAYFIYVQLQFKEIKYIKYFDEKYYKEILSFSGWSLFGNVAAIARSQGINILINIFFGVALNAAYAVTVMVQGVITQFAASLQQAINPQIIKSYAQGELERTERLMHLSSKFSFFVVLILVVPLYLNLDYVLKLWLGLVPDSASLFVSYILLFLLIEVLSSPMMIVVQATGDIKRYQITLGGFIFLNMPLSLLVYCLGGNAESAFVVLIGVSFFSLIYRLYYLKNNLKFKMSTFYSNVLVHITLVLVSVILLLYCVEGYFVVGGFLDLIYKTLVLVLYVVLSIFIFGVKKDERVLFRKIIFKDVGGGRDRIVFK